MAETTIWDKIRDDVQARNRWEERQPVWYRMRHTGIPRRSKPYPGAPDLHYPFADTVLEKLKPFYYKQLFAAEHITELTSQKEQMEEWTEHATRRFDYELKLLTNLLTEELYVIDAMLASGLAFKRQSWNPTTQQIEFLSIEARNIIVPPGTEEIQRAPRFVHVEVLTRDQYAERKAYNQDADLVNQIAGEGDRNGGAGSSDAERERREGVLTCSQKDNILIWNVWERDGGKWTLRTLSGVKANMEIRPPLRNPYDHGELPYVDYRRELKEKGIYSSRGEIEKVAPFETYLCRLWNKKAEALDHFATPLYTSDDESQDGKSLTFHPGQFVPRGIRRVDMGQPPFALDTEMNNVRAIGEQRVLMPDFGIGGQEMGEKRTATEVEQLASLGGITTELRAHVYRLALRASLKQAYALFVQYKRRELDYLFEGTAQQAPPEAIHRNYLVDVGGTAESWNKKLESQKALALFQSLKGDPYTSQVDLRKLLIEKTDVRWVKRLVRDPKDQANTEAVDEMVKLPAVMLGEPIPVEPQENHAVRAEVLYQKMHQLGANGTPVDPVAQQALTGRLNQRLQIWMQQDGKAARAWWKQKQAEHDQHAAAGTFNAAAGGNNVVPFNGGPQPAAIGQ